MDVSICIVSWNTKDLLFECIRSIKAQTVGLKYEIIIVDNGSHDGSSDMIKTYYPDCKLIESPKNLGFAKANNEAVKYATGDYILYLNPDTKLVSNAIYGMCFFLQTNQEFGAVGCKLLNADGTIQYTCASTFPTPFREMCYVFFLNRIFPKSKLVSSCELNYWNHQDSRIVDCLSGACIMARKSIIDELRGFDETTFMYSEDLDLCYRILKKGWKIFYLASETIIHEHGASTRKRHKKFSVTLRKQSNYYFIKKHFGITKAILFKFINGIGSLLRIALIVILSPFLLIHSRKRVDDIIDTIHKYGYIFLWSISAGFVNYNKQDSI